MKRLFLDANVLFTAAHNPRGKAAFLIQLGETKQLQITTSAYALEEAKRNLSRKFPSCLERLTSITETILLVAENTRITCPEGLPEKDWPIYRAALACQANVLITGDLRDFGPLMNDPERSGGLLIQTAADFLNSIQQRP